uniref:Uncharacterized protein n=1 Tax=Glossina austeni TaxID=7395 RepID=A0A1A9URU3_GLOAU
MLKDNQSVMEFLECDEFKGAAGVRNTKGTEINPKNRRQPNRILYSSTSKTALENHLVFAPGLVSDVRWQLTTNKPIHKMGYDCSMNAVNPFNPKLIPGIRHVIDIDCNRFKGHIYHLVVFKADSNQYRSMHMHLISVKL